MIKIFIFLFFIISLSHSADECTSSTSTALNNSTLTYTRSTNLTGTSNDRYYIDVEVPGTVSVSVTGTNVFFSYSETACPVTGGGLTSSTYTFTTAEDFNLRVYRLSAGPPTSYTITVTLTPTANQAPVAINDSASTNQDTAVDIDVLANDTDADGTIDLTSVAVSVSPSNGSVVVNATTGIVTYTPNAGYFGSDSFKYRVNDNLGATSNEGTVDITVNQVLLSPPRANWNLDECSWDGSPSQILDSSGNNYNGTATVGTDTSSDGSLCRSGDFTSNGTSDYVTLTHTALDSLDDFSISVWMKTSNNSNQAVISGARAGQNNEALMWFSNGSTFTPFVKGSNGNISLGQNIANGAWHHFVWTRSGRTNCAYVDGVSRGCVTLAASSAGTIRIANGGLILAQEQDSVGGSFDGNQDFEGLLDEVKIYGSTLSATAVQDIYNNENAGDNYDGSARSCLVCFTPVPAPVADWRLDECSWDGTSADVEDSSTNAYNAIARGGAVSENSSVAGGMLCNIGDFDGSDDYLDSGNILNDIFGPTNNKFTVTAWVNPSTLSNTQTNHLTKNVFFAKASDPYNDNIELGVNPNGSLHIYLDTQGRDTYVDIGSGLSINTWHFVSVSYDNGVVKARIDTNEFTNSTSWAGGGNIDQANGSPVTLGSSIHIDTFFTGYMDEVKVFDGALSTLELDEIYANELSGKNYDGTIRSCKCVSPVADWRLDECLWNAVPDEVIDSSGNNLHSVAITGTSTSDEGQLCRSGDFSSNGITDYVILDESALDGRDDFSISVWMKTANRTQAQAIVSGARAGQNNEALIFFPNKTTFSPYIKGSNGSITIPDIADDMWHHFVWTRNGAQNCGYLDGSLSGCVNLSTGPLSIDSGGLILAQEQDRVGGRFDAGQDFEGLLDELKIYKMALNATQIQDIHDNEFAVVNYDGKTRNCSYCGCSADTYTGTATPLEFEGAEVTLNTTTNSPHWTHVDFSVPFTSVPIVFILPEKSGGHPSSTRIKNITSTGFDAVMAEPQGEDGPHLFQNISYLAVNEGIHKIGNTFVDVGSVDTLKYQQASAGTLTNDEWENITTIFTGCDSAIVGQVQSLNNESGLDIPNPSSIIRSQPWMTTAIKENNQGISISLERSETNEGSISSPETIGYMIAKANVQDSVVDDNSNTITFETIKARERFLGWDNSCATVNFVNTYINIPLIAANKNSKLEADGGWFRRCALTSSSIGLQIDEDGSSYSRGAYSYLTPPQDGERQHIAEDGSIFAFSGTIVIRETSDDQGIFDVWDSFRSINDRNISTKISAQDMTLSLSALNASNDDYKNFTGTVCTQVVDKLTGLGKSAWIKSQFTDTNTTDIIINVGSSIKEADVKISWKKDVDEACPLSTEDNSTVSSDSFAIRPSQFFIDMPPNAVAGVDFNMSFIAGLNNVSPSLDYNETEGASFEVSIAESNPLCLTGLFSPALHGWSFVDGKHDTGTNYNEVGVLDINITEHSNCQNRFAAVDCDDENVSGFWNTDTDLSITKAIQTLSIVPHHFKIEAELFDFNASSFTYLSQDLSMSAFLRAVVTAENEQNATMQNYNTDCYAQDITLNITHNNVTSARLNELIYIVNDTSDINTSNTIAKNALLTISYPSSNFTTSNKGMTDLDVYMNFDRNETKPVNPFAFFITDFDVSDGTASETDTDSVEHVFIVDSNASFYYGRLHAEDIATSLLPVSNILDMQVYDETSSVYTQGMMQRTLFWYLNAPHNTNYAGHVTQAIASNNTLIDNVLGGYTFVYNPVGLGHQSIDITSASTSQATIHLKTQQWLWYSPSGFGSSYADTAGTDCSMHPCFKFTVVPNNTALKIESGDFNGTIVPDVNRSEYIKKGVKLFR